MMDTEVANTHSPSRSQIGERGMQSVRIFISSPGDTQMERMRTERVVERLNGEFAGTVKLEAIRWEHDFYKADATFQEQIPEAANCDIVVAILRQRLGTALPNEFATMPNGEPYPSGTAYEILTAIQTDGLPDVYVFRCPDPPLVRLDDAETNALVTEQWDRLKAFFTTWFVTPNSHFKAAFHDFHTTDEFEEQIEALLRKWLEENVLEGRSVIWPIETNGSPFRGLAAFGAKHAPVFFGRSRDTAKAVDSLKDAVEHGIPFLLVVGASGTGKSSLTRAGIVPRLTTPGVVPSVDIWRVAMMRPGDSSDSPIAELAARLFDGPDNIVEEEKGRIFSLPELAASDFATPKELASLLDHADESSVKPILRALDLVGDSEQQSGGYDRPVRAGLLLVVDQLGELFGPDISLDQRRRFARLLTVLLSTGRVWVIATLRANLYEHLLKQPELLDLKMHGASYDLSPPGAAELAEIVRGPAQVASLVYETDAVTGQRLDERLLGDADRPDMLSLLQFTLAKLFDQRKTDDGETRMTFAAYESFGGINGAISQAAEEALQTLSHAEINTLPKLLRLLVKQTQNIDVDGGSGFTLRPVPLTQIEAVPLMQKLVNALVTARILVVTSEGASSSVRLIHQRVIEGWGRAHEAVRANTNYFRILNDVKTQFLRWIQSDGHYSTLLSNGESLREARDLNRRFGEELEPEIRYFIKASRWRATLRTSHISNLVLAMLVVSLLFEYGNFTFSRDLVFFLLVVIWVVTWSFNLWVYRNYFSLVIETISQSARFSHWKSKKSRLKARLRLITTNAVFASAFAIILSLQALDETIPWDSFWLSGKDSIQVVANILFLTLALAWPSTVLILRTRFNRGDNAPSSQVPMWPYVPIFALGALTMVMAVLDIAIEDNPLTLASLLFIVLAVSWAITGAILRTRHFQASAVAKATVALPPDTDTPWQHSPIFILSALAIVSAGMSFLAFPPSHNASPLYVIIIPQFYAPAILFGLVLSYGEFRWGAGNPRTATLVVFGVLSAWLMAYMIAYNFKILASSEIFGGFIGGAVGAALTGLLLSAIRTPRQWAIISAIGGVTGLLLNVDYLLYPAWQISFAAYFGYCLSKLPPALPKTDVELCKSEE